MFFRSPYAVLALLLLIFHLFVPNAYVSLWDEDEAAYAGFALNMLEEGDWVNPHFDWSRIHRKTPAHFWGIALSFMGLGFSEFALRLTSALSVLGSVLLLYVLGARLWGQAQARTAALVLGSSMVLPMLSKMALTDGPLLFCQTLGALSLWLYLKAPRKLWKVSFWLAFALGVLVKGPPIIIFLGGMWALLFLFHPQRWRLIGLHPWFYGLLALLPFGLWAWLSWQRDEGALVLFLYDWYIAKRVGGSVLGQTGPPGYHLVFILLGFLPWLPYLLPGLAKFIREDSRDADRANWFLPLVAWLVWAWLFYEFMSSKLPSYALGAHPAVAAIVAAYIHRRFAAEPEDKPLYPWLYQTGVWAFALLWLALNGAVAVGGYWIFGRGYALVLAVFAVQLPFMGFLAWRSLRADSSHAPGWLGLCGLLFWALAGITVLPILEYSPIKSLKPLALEATRRSGGRLSGVPVILDGIGPKQAKISLLVYLRRYNDIYELRQDLPATYARYAQPDSAKAVFILGQEGRDYFVQQPGFDSSLLYQVDWWSTDDELRNHPFYLLSRGS